MNKNLCTSAQAFALGVGDCSPKVGAVKAFILSKEKKTLPANADAKETIQGWLSENSAVMLVGMQQRDANNEAPVTGSLGYGYSEELRGVIVQDNFVFPQDLCSQKGLVKLVRDWKEGYAYVLTHTKQIVGFENNGALDMFPVSITAMDTTGVFADLANIQTDTLTLRYGLLADFVENRAVYAVDFTERDFVQPVQLLAQGTAANMTLKDACSGTLVQTDAANISVRATVDGANVQATVAGSSGGTYVVTLNPVATSGKSVTLQATWKTGQVTNGISNILKYILG